MKQGLVFLDYFFSRCFENTGVHGMEGREGPKKCVHVFDEVGTFATSEMVPSFCRFQDLSFSNFDSKTGQLEVFSVQAKGKVSARVLFGLELAADLCQHGVESMEGVTSTFLPWTFFSCTYSGSKFDVVFCIFFEMGGKKKPLTSFSIYQHDECWFLLKVG